MTFKKEMSCSEVVIRLFNFGRDIMNDILRSILNILLSYTYEQRKFVNICILNSYFFSDVEQSQIICQEKCRERIMKDFFRSILKILSSSTYDDQRKFASICILKFFYLHDIFRRWTKSHSPRKMKITNSDGVCAHANITDCFSFERLCLENFHSEVFLTDTWRLTLSSWKISPSKTRK